MRSCGSSSGAGQGEAEGRCRPPGRRCRARCGPPWYSTILRHIARPMPVPAYSSLACSRWKITKIRSAYSASMPMPLSRTRTRHSSPSSLGADARPRGGAVAAELDRVADQVLEHGGEQRRLAAHASAAAPASTRRRASSIARREVVERLRRSDRRRGRPARTRPVVRPTREKASRSLISCCIRLAPSTAKSMYWSAALVELALVALLEQLAEARHLAQRLLQVVRGDVGELLELGVRALRARAPARRAARGPRAAAAARRRSAGASSSMSSRELDRCRAGRRCATGCVELARRRPGARVAAEPLERPRRRSGAARPATRPATPSDEHARSRRRRP